MGWLRAKSPGLLVAAVAAAGFAQTQAPPQPTFRTEANYVRVDVFPTKDGAAVNDLAAADFEVLESGVPQRVEQFEHVVIRANLSQDLRADANTLAQSRAMAENPRSRVFVIFLDTGHVGVEGSRNIRQPLVDALNKLIGPDDVFAVMTPEMSATDITFARNTTTVEGMLARYWAWGERNEPVGRDPQEQQYVTCYPGGIPIACADGSTADDRGVADAMIERRREKLTLDALTDLVRYLRGVREERKAIIAVSDGWRLFVPRRWACQPQRVVSGAGAAEGGRRSAQRQTDRPHATHDLRLEPRLVRTRSDRAGGAGRRAGVSRPDRRSQSREYVVLSGGSARPRGVRRADRQADQWPAARWNTDGHAVDDRPGALPPTV